ncbi:hypothetical protein V1523DRAFT_424603 [Lipomyces doorenjongii]
MAPKDCQMPAFVSGPSFASKSATPFATPLRAGAIRETPQPAELLHDTGDELDSDTELPTVADMVAAGGRGSTFASAVSSSAASASSSVSSAAETPAPRSRVFYTEEHKLAIFKLCNLYQGEYTPGNRTKFFQTIASLFNEENDMNTPTVRTLVVNMLKNRRKEHKEKSGVAEADTDLKQAMDAFLVRFDSVNAEVNAGQSQNAHDKHARRADQDLTLMVRDKMLYGKRTADEGQSDGSEADQVTYGMDVPNRPRKKSRRANAPIAIDIGMDSASANIVGAFDRLAAVIATPPPVSADNDRHRLSKVEEKIQQFESRFDSIDSALKVLLERSTR